MVKSAKERGLDITGPDGLLKLFAKTVLETALEEEMTEHLGYEKHDPAGRDGKNSRNGTGEGVPVDAVHEDPRNDNRGKTVLEIAVQADQVAVVRLLLGLGADPDQPIHDGRRRMDYPVIFIVAEGWRFRDSPLGYPLSYAAAVTGRHELAVALLGGGARPGGTPTG